MNMQNLMRQAEQMRKEITQIQTKLEDTSYEGTSSLVKVIVNGKKELKKFEITNREDFSLDDLDMLEDMILVALNDAFKKVESDKEKKLSKFQGLSGLM